MAEITKINIKGVDYDIGGTGGGGLKVVDVVELTAEQIDTVEAEITIQLNETRFNELINADVLNIYNSNGASIFLYKEGKPYSYPDFGITNMVSFSTENISVINNNANFTSRHISLASGVEGDVSMYQLAYNFTGIYIFSMQKQPSQ